MNNKYVQDYQIQPLGHSTAPSTSYNSSLWNNSSNINNTNASTSSNLSNANQYQIPTPQSYSTQQSMGGVNPLARGITGTSEDKLKLQIRVKDSQIESLENEVRALHESLKVLNADNAGVLTKQETVPVSVNEIFNKLNRSRLEILEELNDTKLRLESLITAYTLNPTNSATDLGRYDELEVSHRILIKLENLKKENEDLLKSLSFGKLKNMEMDINLLKQENADLKSENDQLKEKIRAYENK